MTADETDGAVCQAEPVGPRCKLPGSDDGDARRLALELTVHKLDRSEVAVLDVHVDGADGGIVWTAEVDRNAVLMPEHAAVRAAVAPRRELTHTTQQAPVSSNAGVSRRDRRAAHLSVGDEDTEGLGLLHKHRMVEAGVRAYPDEVPIGRALRPLDEMVSNRVCQTQPTRLISDGCGWAS